MAFQQYFSYIVAVSFIGGGNRNLYHILNLLYYPVHHAVCGIRTHIVSGDRRRLHK